MELGKHIYELRKKLNLSQEQLAERVGVSRQTISKWELGETAPDIRQAKVLSQVFNVSLDELTGNDTKEAVYEKVSNTERLAGLVIKILKIFGILMLVSILVTVIAIVLFSGVRGSSSVESDSEKVFMGGELYGEEYDIGIYNDGSIEIKGLPKDVKKAVVELIDLSDLDGTVEDIEAYLDGLREDSGNE